MQRTIMETLSFLVQIAPLQSCLISKDRLMVSYTYLCMCNARCSATRKNVEACSQPATVPIYPL
jgi:hypothetical protein